jgi:hypothetical protein
MADEAVRLFVAGLLGSAITLFFSEFKGWPKSIGIALAGGVVAKYLSGAVVGYANIPHPTADHFEATAFLLGMGWYQLLGKILRYISDRRLEDLIPANVKRAWAAFKGDNPSSGNKDPP